LLKTAQLMPNRAEFLISAAAKMTPSEGEAILRNIGWLSSIDPKFQSALLRSCRWKLFEPGETIVGAGDKSAPFIGIACGTVSITTALGPPDTPLTHIAHPGIWTGFVAFIGDRGTDNETVARTPVYAAVISRSAVEGLLNEHPAWWRDVARLALWYGETAVNIAADLLIRDSDRRCAATLLRIANCRFAGDKPTVAHANQTDIATIANLSRNTTSALLGELERSGMVARHYNHIDILDPLALRAVADG
jgi:CRP-like cAMP-binding protein